MEETVKDRILAYMKAKSLSQNRFEEAIDMSHGYASILEQDVIADFERLDGLIDWFFST